MKEVIRYEVQESGKGFKVFDNMLSAFVTKEYPLEVAEGICKDFNKMVNNNSKIKTN